MGWMLPEHFSTLSSPGGFGEGTCRAATPRAAIPQPHPAMNPCAQWLHASSPRGTNGNKICLQLPRGALQQAEDDAQHGARVSQCHHQALVPGPCPTKPPLLPPCPPLGFSLFFFGFLPRMRPKGEGRNPLQSALLPSSVSIIFNIIPVEFIGATAWENDFTSGSFINF